MEYVYDGKMILSGVFLLLIIQRMNKLKINFVTQNTNFSRYVGRSKEFLFQLVIL